MNSSERDFCQCGKPEKWADHPAFPVEFDAKLNEYHLMHGEKQPRCHMIHYCFWCGGRLPESRRGEFFTEPDESEVAEVRALLAGAISAADALGVLGEPDETFHWEESGDLQLHDEKRWDKCYRYSSRWRTLVLNVMEFSDGPIGWALSGQFVGALQECRGADGPDNRPWWKFWA